MAGFGFIRQSGFESIALVEISSLNRVVHPGHFLGEPPGSPKRMKLLCVSLILVLSSCGPSPRPQNELPATINLEDYSCLAGLAWPLGNDSLQHPVWVELRKEGVDCFEGDHAGRMTDLYCRRSHFSKAQAVIDQLPEDLRELVYLFD